jgi:hypothetical protein
MYSESGSTFIIVGQNAPKSVFAKKSPKAWQRVALLENPFLALCCDTTSPGKTIVRKYKGLDSYLGIVLHLPARPLQAPQLLHLGISATSTFFTRTHLHPSISTSTMGGVAVATETERRTARESPERGTKRISQ